MCFCFWETLQVYVYLLIQFSILILDKRLRCLLLSVTKIRLLAIAVEPIKISKSLSIAPDFFNRAFSFA